MASTTATMEQATQTKPRRSMRGMGLAIAVLLVFVATFALYDVNWVASYVIGFLGSLALIWFGFPDARRLGVYCWLLVVTVVLVATWVQTAIASSYSVAAWAASSRIGSIIYSGVALQAAIGLFVGVIVAIFLFVVPLLLLMWLASVPLLAQHEYKDITQRDAMRWLFTRLFEIQYPWVIVDDGQETRGKEQGLLKEIGGPGKVVIRPGNAVVLEKGGKITKISGPGVVKTGLYERVHRIVRLNPLSEITEATDVLTSDGVPLTFILNVGYQIEPLAVTIDRLEEGLQGERGKAWNDLARLISSVKARQEEDVIDCDYPVWRENVRKAAMNVTPAGWEKTSVGGAVTQLRDTVGSYRFDQILRPVCLDENLSLPKKFEEDERTIRQIEKYVLEKWAPVATEKFGIQIRSFDIRGVTLPDVVHERLIEWWAEHWGKMAHVRRRGPEWRVNRLEQGIKLEGAQAEADVKGILGVAESRLLIEEARGKAEAKYHEGVGERKFLVEKAQARLEASEINIDTAKANATAQQIEAEAEKQAFVARGEGEAEVRVMQFKVMLDVLRHFLDRDAMIEFIRFLHESMAKAEDRRLFIATVRDTRLRGGLMPGDVAGSADTSKWSLESLKGEAESETGQ